MNLEPIIDATAEIFAVHKVLLVGQGRADRLARPRFAFFHVAREATGLSLPTIGLAMGGRDHTTVMHGINRAARLMKDQPEFALKVEQLMEVALRHVDQFRAGVVNETLETRRRRVAYHVLNSLERLALHNPAGFDHLILMASGYGQAGAH
jgi:hypothetical protein